MGGGGGGGGVELEVVAGTSISPVYIYFFLGRESSNLIRI